MTIVYIANIEINKEYFNLNQQIVSHPPFPGLEKNYLRAQVARISAATTVSPIGYFRFDDNEEEEDTEESGIIIDFFTTSNGNGESCKSAPSPGPDAHTVIW